MIGQLGASDTHQKETQNEQEKQAVFNNGGHHYVFVPRIQISDNTPSR